MLFFAQLIISTSVPWMVDLASWMFSVIKAHDGGDVFGHSIELIVGICGNRRCRHIGQVDNVILSL